jgi:hypothetical protein
MVTHTIHSFVSIFPLADATMSPNHPPYDGPEPKRIPALDNAVRANVCLRGFRSGGGLRVFRLEGFAPPAEDLEFASHLKLDLESGTYGYGEGPTAEQALEELLKTINNPTPYKCMWITGNPNPTTDFDSMMRHGWDVHVRETTGGLYLAQLRASTYRSIGHSGIGVTVMDAIDKAVHSAECQLVMPYPGPRSEAYRSV